MISGGDGGLNIGEVKLQQFVLLNSDPIMNEEFISLFKKEIYRTLEFQITGTPEKGFYIWYRIV